MSISVALAHECYDNVGYKRQEISRDNGFANRFAITHAMDLLTIPKQSFTLCILSVHRRPLEKILYTRFVQLLPQLSPFGLGFIIIVVKFSVVFKNTQRRCRNFPGNRYFCPSMIHSGAPTLVIVSF